MGVKGLWSLLEPVGRRINIEALQNKRLAVDASIWLFQFIQAMRDERGELIRNAHVLGFFRRICRLLFHRIRPVFVFDGATPALKRQTTAARRRRREQQHAKLRKTAEKLLMNQLKQRALGNVSNAQLKNAAQAAAAAAAAGSSGVTGTAAGHPGQAGRSTQASPAAVAGRAAASLAAEEVIMIDSDEEQQQAEEDAEQAAARARKGKAPAGEEGLTAPDLEIYPAAAPQRRLADGEGTSSAAAARSATAADELLAAQLAAMDGVDGEAAVAVAADVGALSAFTSRSQERHLQQQQQKRRQGRDGSSSEEEEDGELEIVVPEGSSLDPVVLSTLPPSVALELMAAERERLQAANRQALEARRGAPVDFSQFQMQQYLAATQFRRRVEEVKDAMNTAAAGGSAARRIAGEAGREYILHKDTEAPGAAAAPPQPNQPSPQQQALSPQPAPAAGGAPAAGEVADAQPASQHPTEAAAAGATGGGTGDVLDICFEVELGDEDESNASAEDELAWEDVEEPGGSGHAAQPQHWRERAAARRRYWSVSHGFQMGRKLAAWGGQEGQEGQEDGAAQQQQQQQQQQGGREEGGEEEKQGEEGGGAVAGVAGTPTPRKGLIARSPPSGSPVRQVPEDEDAQLQEAIRLSLAELAGSPGASRQATPTDGGDVQLSLAAQADQLLQQQRGRHHQDFQPFQQQQHDIAAQQPAQQAGQAEEAAEYVDLVDAGEAEPLLAPQQDQPARATAARAAGRGAEPQALAPAAGASAAGVQAASDPGEQSSGSDADLLWEDAEPAAARESGAAVQQAGAGLLSSVNRKSAQRLEEWLGRSGTDGGEQQQQQQQAGPAACEQTAAPAAVSKEQPGEEGEGMEWETVEEAGGAAGAGTATAQDGAAEAGRPAGMQDQRVVAQPAALPPKPAGGLPLAASIEQQLPVAKERQGAASEAARTTEAGRLAHAAVSHRGRQPTLMAAAGPRAPGAGSRQVRFSDTVQVKVLPAQERQGQDEPQAASAAAEQEASLSLAAPSEAAPFLAQPQAQPAAAASPAAPAAAGQAGAEPAAPAGPAELGGFTAAELEQLAGEDEEWQDVLSPPASQQQQQPGSDAIGRGHQQQGEEQLSLIDVDAQLEALQAEERRLRASQRAGRGQVEAPTADMYQECMELLTMFGLPYIIAPQEAEAQCAWLDAAGLVDGVVTDDNDALLFGARRVYRHIFENKRYAEEYRCEDVQQELGLGRAELAALAQLLGSDYCEGVAGVGIVNAVEIVNAFPGTDGLKAFRDWLTGPDEQLMELARGSGGGRGRGRGQGSKGRQQQQQQEQQSPGSQNRSSQPAEEVHSDSEEVAQQQDQEEAEERQAALAAEFKRRHRGVRRNWEAPANFPSAAVAEAYASPKVDTSKDKFTFGRPDVELLRQFCASRFGWTQQQADELLTPVVQAFEQRQSQLTLDSFLTMRQRFAKIKSKRLQKAVAGIAGGEHEEIMLREEGGQPAAPRKRAGSRKRKAAEAAPQDGGSPAGQGADMQQPLQLAGQAAQEEGGDKRQRQQRSAAGGGRGIGRGGTRGRGSAAARGRSSMQVEHGAAADGGSAESLAPVAQSEQHQQADEEAVAGATAPAAAGRRAPRRGKGSAGAR